MLYSHGLQLVQSFGWAEKVAEDGPGAKQKSPAPQADEFDAIGREDLVMRVKENLREMQASELLVLPTLVWDATKHTDKLALRRVHFPSSDCVLTALYSDSTM